MLKEPTLVLFVVAAVGFPVAGLAADSNEEREQNYSKPNEMHTADERG